VVVEIGAAAVAYFSTGKDCGCHVQTLNQAAAFCWWRAALEASRLWRGSKHLKNYGTAMPHKNRG